MIRSLLKRVVAVLEKYGGEGWVELALTEPIIMQAGEAFIAVPER